MSATGHGRDIGPRLNVVNEILSERERQDEKWGQQDHPSLPPYDRLDVRLRTMRLTRQGMAKEVVRRDALLDQSSWLHIAIEELAEAAECDTDAERRPELIQVGAVIVAWIEAIDRRAKKPEAP